jgi:penicillin-binding protein 1C
VTRSLHSIAADAQTVQITDRYGVPLSQSYQNRWNTYDHVPLHSVPDFLKMAFLLSEDRQFYTHHGVNWKARGAALWQNVRYRRTVRGASTIDEQVVRMITPRSRTVWSKWLEGFEAIALDAEAGKQDIFEFYLNQVPYAANRRGVRQAARYYFNRDLSTLTQREMLALVVMARAPSAYDLYRHPGRTNKAIERLAEQMTLLHAITPEDRKRIDLENLVTAGRQAEIGAEHFTRYVRLHESGGRGQTLQTTLDSGLQAQVRDILNQRVAALARRNVHNAAALVIDHQTGEILSWAVAGNENTPGAQIDAVLVPRQPGSALKPFLYTRTLEKGWTAATLLDDSPMAEAVGNGLHRFRNYSNTYYGPVTLREALGNSLNIPALHAIDYVGTADYLGVLHALGITSLDRGSDIYDDGLALGDGEISLLEMTGAYMTLAHRGIYRAPHLLMQAAPPPSTRVFSDEAASLMGNILSDPWARQMEFGASSVLNLPMQTAAKTGTSTDYRDAWTFGYNDRYVIGIWMGNLDRAPMDGVTGSVGPALAMRSVFAVLNRNRDTARLYLSPNLVREEVCIRPEEGGICPKRSEWFIGGTEPRDEVGVIPGKRRIEMIRPTEGLQIAWDPRIPAEHQKFRFELGGLESGSQVQWILDGDILAENDRSTLLWPVQRGRHRLAVTVRHQDSSSENLVPVEFTVK